MELALLEQFLTYAQVAARAEQFYTARDVLLEGTAHVSVEDPRLHLSLGNIAVALYDSQLLDEAKPSAVLRAHIMGAQTRSDCSIPLLGLRLSR